MGDDGDDDDKDVKKRKEDDDDEDDDEKEGDVEERKAWKKCQGLKGQEKRQCIKKIIEMWRAGKMKRLAQKIKKMCTKCDKACNGTNTTNVTNVSKTEVYLDERKKGKRPNKAQMCAECTKCCAMKPSECMSMLKEKRKKKTKEAGKMKRLAGKIKKMCTKCDKVCNGTNTTNGTNVSKTEVFLDERKKGKRPNKAEMCAECTKCCAMKPSECMS